MANPLTLLGVSGGGAFNPLSLSPLLWLKADLGTFQDTGLVTPAALDGDPVGGWQDQSGNGNHATQATAGKRPALKLNIQNGKPVVRFDGVSDFLQTVSFSASQPIHVFLALSQRTWNGPARIMDGTTTDQVVLEQLNVTPELDLFDGSAFTCSSTALAVATFGTLSILHNGASSELRVNGGTAATGNPGSGGFTAGLTLGSKFGGAIPTAIDLGELLVYAPALSTGQRQQVEQYLRTRWGTP
jgi:hypothetical protein